ncbi:MAG TPA: hydrogenase maturation nickel metallochaperone HypA [Polyangiaceae bacterium]|nr:hydrogenase maturation nickel metallochaperone HypA [Polyangiaceae bacterium]
MHEMSIVAGILDAVTQRSGGRRIVRVVVEIGRMTAVLPDALRFGFEVASQGTDAEGATLDIVTLLGNELRVREMEVV